MWVKEKKGKSLGDISKEKRTGEKIRKKCGRGAGLWMAIIDIKGQKRGRSSSNQRKKHLEI